MPNPTIPFGVKPYKIKNADVKTIKCYIPASYATALFENDPVVITGTSNPAITINGSYYPEGQLPEINKAATTGSIYGVILGFDVIPNSFTSSASYNPASTARTATVLLLDNEDIYEVMADSAASLDRTVIGLNANLTYATSGSTTTGLSGAQLNSSTVATTSSFQFHILSVSPREDVSVGTNCIFLVTPNAVTLANAIAGL